MRYLVATAVKGQKVSPTAGSGKTAMQDSIQIEETAACWLARKDCEHWSAADQLQLTAWLEASMAHRVAYIRLEAAWWQTRHLKSVAAVLPVGELPSAGKLQLPTSSRR
jgi:ferric-dicitrate binding protein FerR (iron transport regulator)